VPGAGRWYFFLKRRIFSLSLLETDLSYFTLPS
jgi:hypothetical protein